MFLQRKQKKRDNSIYVTPSGDRVDLRTIRSEGGVLRLGKKQKGLNKFGARTAEYRGITYHSGAEARYAQTLDLEKRAGLIRAWRRQVRVPLVVYGKKVASLIVDFEVELPDGSLELREVKGFRTPDWVIRWKLLQAIYAHEHPEIGLVVIDAK